MHDTAALPLLIGLLATAGAMPLCRRLVLGYADRPGLAAQAAMPSVAGAGMLAGGVVALFYADATLSTLMVPLLASLALGSLGAGLERAELRRGARPWRRHVLLIASVAVMAALFGVVDPYERLTHPMHSLVIVLTLVTPYASARMTGLPDRPSTPSAVALAQGLLLVATVAVAALRAPGGPDGFTASPANAHLAAFVGVLLGALIYQCRVPWRDGAIASCSVAARLVLGLLVAWFAIDIGSGRPVAERVEVALLWILSVPVFEIARESMSAFRRESVTLDQSLHVGHAASPVLLVLATALSGAVGIALWLSGLPTLWIVAAWALALASWAFLPSPNRLIARAPARRDVARS